MGPNGSGKSTLAPTLLGSPEYQVTAGRICSTATTSPTGRPTCGPRPGCSSPSSTPGDPGRVGHQLPAPGPVARKGIDLSVLELRLAIMEWMQRLEMDPSFADRYLNEGFSGGEKKRNEILQMAILEPELAILDETDSGLDIDALQDRRPRRPGGARRPARLGIVLITHYQRLLDHLAPDHVHMLVDGASWRPAARSSPSGSRREGYEAAGDEPRRDRCSLDRRHTHQDATSPSSTGRVDGKPLVYLDSAPASQKPRRGASTP